MGRLGGCRKRNAERGSDLAVFSQYLPTRAGYRVRNCRQRLLQAIDEAGEVAGQLDHKTCG